MLLYKKVLKHKWFETAGLLIKWVNESEADVSNITYDSNSGQYALFYWKIEVDVATLKNELENSSTLPNQQY